MVFADIKGQEFCAQIVEDTACRLTVRISGDLDIPTIGLVCAAMHDVWVHESLHVILDLTGVEFIGSSGVHMLLEQHSQALHRGVLLDVVSSPIVERVLVLAGVRDSLHTSVSALWG